MTISARYSNPCEITIKCSIHGPAAFINSPAGKAHAQAFEFKHRDCTGRPAPKSRKRVAA